MLCTLILTDTSSLSSMPTSQQICIKWPWAARFGANHTKFMLKDGTLPTLMEFTAWQAGLVFHGQPSCIKKLTLQIKRQLSLWCGSNMLRSSASTVHIQEVGIKLRLMVLHYSEFCLPRAWTQSPSPSSLFLLCNSCIDESSFTGLYLMPMRPPTTTWSSNATFLLITK